MRVGVIDINEEPAVVLEDQGRWFDFTGAHRVFQLIEHQFLGMPVRSVAEILQAGHFNQTYFGRVIALLEEHAMTDKYTIETPSAFRLPLRPGKVIGVGRNYAAHAHETGHEVPSEPIFFSKATTACIGDGEAIVIRESYGRVDHEGELAIVVGRRCRDVQEEDARECIAGYTLLNDVTAREMQKRDIENAHPWFRSKSLDTFCPLGPYIVLRDDLPWPMEVDIEVKVNGETRQKSNTRQFIFPVPRLIAHITRFMTLEPGDVIATGTPEGISPIHAGDIVEVIVPEIGVLRNRCVSG